MKNYEKLINFSELSRLIVGDRNNIRPSKPEDPGKPSKFSKKHLAAVHKLFHNDLPRWSDEFFQRDNRKIRA